MSAELTKINEKKSLRMSERGCVVRSKEKFSEISILNWSLLVLHWLTHKETRTCEAAGLISGRCPLSGRRPPSDRQTRRSTSGQPIILPCLALAFGFAASQTEMRGIAGDRRDRVGNHREREREWGKTMVSWSVPLRCVHSCLRVWQLKRSLVYYKFRYIN
jgi:hypothetical protein